MFVFWGCLHPQAIDSKGPGKENEDDRQVFIDNDLYLYVSTYVCISYIHVYYYILYIMCVNQSQNIHVSISGRWVPGCRYSPWEVVQLGSQCLRSAWSLPLGRAVEGWVGWG